MNAERYKEKLYYSCKDACSKEWEVIAPHPPKIMFELTNACNHRCVFCANRRIKREMGVMAREVFITIAKEAFSIGVKEAALYTTGESLLHPEIVDFVRIAKEIGFSYTYLSSNGVLLTPVISRKLLEAGLDSLRISINAGTRETYRKIHGRDDFEIVVANIREYDRIRKELNSASLLSISCVLTKHTLKDKEILEKALSSYVNAIKWTDVRTQGGNMPHTIRKLSTKKSNLSNGIKSCGLLWNGMHVDYAGNLTLCCVDFDGSMVVGNIMERGLMNCWNGPEMKEHRRLHLSSSLDPESLCYKCLKG